MSLDELEREINEIFLGSPENASPAIAQNVGVSIEYLIEDTKVKWTGEIKDEQNYLSAKNRLDVLQTYLPTLKGKVKQEVQNLVNVLSERIREYEDKSLNYLVTSVYDFVQKPINNDAELTTAKDYLAKLKNARVNLVGNWANTVDTLINKLENLIEQYQGKQNISLGSPLIEEIPKWLQGFASQPLFYYKDYRETPTHSIDSRYAKIEVIKPDIEYKVGFEDRDEDMVKKGYPYKPDYDYDEPVLHIVRDGNKMKVTIEKYGGLGISRIKYFDKVLWDPVGGLFKSNVGSTKTIEIPEEFVPVPAVPPEEKPSQIVSIDMKKKILTYLPWAISFGALLISGITLMRKK